MKTWFPFTDYDFYAYLTSGSLLIASADLALNNGALLAAPAWSVVSIVVFFSGAYVAGHLIAFASSQLLELGLARTLIAPPATILLDRKKPSFLERQAAAVIGRYYEPLGEPIREKIIAAAATSLGRPGHTLSAEDIFQVAHRVGVTDQHASGRIADLQNQYGFCRNTALVAMMATVLFAFAASGGDRSLLGWSLITVGTAAGMTIRFLKFYAAFTAEVLRTLIK